MLKSTSNRGGAPFALLIWLLDLNAELSEGIVIVPASAPGVSIRCVWRVVWLFQGEEQTSQTNMEC
jgi:hypothetical protein